MPQVADPSRTTASGVARRRWAGVAIGVVVLLALVITASFAIPASQRRERAKRVRATAADLTHFADLFRQYASTHGDWPKGARPGEYPAGMESLLGGTRWRDPAPIGGAYAWEIDGTHGRVHTHASLRVAPAPPHPQDAVAVTELQQRLLAAGTPPARVRRGTQGEPILVLEE